MVKKKSFSEEELKDIVRYYLEDFETLSKIGEKFSVSKTVISRVLKELGVEKRKNTTKKRQNNRIFQHIDSHEKAYWLGFLYADGNVFFGKGNATISINLKRKDKEHLEKFLSFIGSNAEVTDYTNSNSHFKKICKPTEMSRVAIYSVEMARDLTEKGCIPRKSLKAQRPLIPKEFYHSFALGYFDGDGSIFQINDGKGYGFSILGTFELMTFFKDEVFSLEDTKIEKTITENNNYYIRCGGTIKPYEALKRIYLKELEGTCLQRKLSRFKKLETVVLHGNI